MTSGVTATVDMLCEETKCDESKHEPKASNLAFVGKVVSLDNITNSDFLYTAVVDCGVGGKWRGVVRKEDFGYPESACFVFLHDAYIPENLRGQMPFMKDTNWHVRMRRFRGAPSEVVIMPVFQLNFPYIGDWERALKKGPGFDITEMLGITKYSKPLAESLMGEAKGYMPHNIPKTDEDNYQFKAGLVASLRGHAYYITQKCEGSSTTAYKKDGQFGVCGRKIEYVESDKNGYWKVANRYDLRNKLPEGVAVQWETCGPGINGNPMGLQDVDGFIFSAYYINEHKYFDFQELVHLCKTLQMPMVKIIEEGVSFPDMDIEELGKGFYDSGKPQEGVVIRSQYNVENGKPISFKVLNLDYEG